MFITLVTSYNANWFLVGDVPVAIALTWALIIAGAMNMTVALGIRDAGSEELAAGNIKRETTGATKRLEWIVRGLPAPMADAGWAILLDLALDAVAIHSARLYVGELFSLTKETGITGGLEALFNLNKEQALDASDSTGATKGVSAFKDTRLIGKVGLTTVLHKSLSFGFGFTLKYDQNPAPRPSGGAMLAADFQPFSDKVDTLTEASLLYTFL